MTPKYVTQDGFAARYSTDELYALTDRNGDDVVDQEVWEAAASDAEAEVDAALAARYQLPLEHIPNAVRWAAYAATRIRLTPFAGEDHPARQTYDDARTWLRRVSKGEVSLGLTAERQDQVGGVKPAVRGGGPRYTERYFDTYRTEAPNRTYR